MVGLDRSTFPRPKTCGGGVSARSIPYLPDGWESVPHEVTTGVHLTYGDRGHVDVDTGIPIAYQFRREEFDLFLLEKARKNGALIETGVKAGEISWDGVNFWIGTERGDRYKAPILFAADGASSQVSRHLLKRKLDPGSSRNWRRSEDGVPRKHFPSSEMHVSCPGPIPSGLVHIDLGLVSGGYGWAFPKSGKAENVGVIGFTIPLSDPSKVLRAFIERVWPNLPGAHQLEEPRTWFVPDYRGTDRHGRIPGLFFLGDAGGLVDPFLGEGIYYAVLSAQRAVSEILRNPNRPGEASRSYATWVRRDIFRDFAQARRLAALIYRFPGLYFRLVQKYPRILTLYAAILRGVHDYRSFSVSIGRSLLYRPFRGLFPGQGRSF